MKLKITYNAKPAPEAQKQLEILQQAVAKALEKKRKLGQYYVVWKDGKPVFEGENAPDSTAFGEPE